MSDPISRLITYERKCAVLDREQYIKAGMLMLLKKKPIKQLLKEARQEQQEQKQWAKECTGLPEAKKWVSLLNV